MRSADTRNIGANRSLLARVVFTPEGEVRTLVVVGMVVFGLAVLAAGTFGGLVAAGLGSPAVLGFWVLIAFVAIKLPILGLVWYLLGRSGESTVKPEWSDQEIRSILDYLRRETDAASRRRDAAERLAYYSREAWFVADRAPEGFRGEAVDLAVRIQGMADATAPPAGPEDPPDPGDPGDGAAGGQSLSGRRSSA